MDKQSVQNYLVGQISTFKKIRVALEGTKNIEGIKKFDKKVINKNVQELFREYAREIGIHYVIFRRYEYGPGTYNLDVRVVGDSGSSYKYGISEEVTIYNIPIIDGKRFDYSGFCSAVDAKLEGLDNTISKLEKELKELDKIMTEYNAILKSMEDFKDKYSYYTRQGLQF